ncbi:outer membrane lipid asymmetry maintenance protein MlaD [Albirhodobacter sp. R86504]|uniref:outer membrane lipid asymmetry maintenance protein MlaD n=1 Tax=Albirhodobacter sp. R86504 TaxID=3093848 RepID=UPI00366FD232
MSENRAEILTGALVLAIAVGFLGWSMQGRGAGSGGSYELKASFRSVEGVTVGTDVRLAGVKVGTVTSLGLNPQTYFADATISVREGVVLPADSAALVSSEGLLGGNFIELQPGGSLENYAAGDEIEDTQGSVSVISMMMKFVDGGGSSETDSAAQ